MEATRNWPFFYDLLKEHVEWVELAHAKEVRVIATAAVKTDQIDATVLAHLARLNKTCPVKIQGLSSLGCGIST